MINRVQKLYFPRRKNARLHRLHKQQGISIIGLIVGIAVAASFLLLITKMYANSKKTESYQSARSALLEEGRFILTDLRRIISVAGLDITNADVTTLGSDGLQVVNTASDTQDHLAVAFRRSGGCRGNIGTTTLGTLNNTEIFFNNGRLQCRDNAGAARGTGQAVTLTNNISGFRILYGVDSDDDGFPNRYVDDSDLGGTNIDTIRSIRVGLLLNSGGFLVSNSDAHNNDEYDLLGEDVDIDLNSNNNNRRLFAVYETTIYLRNLSKAVIRFQ